MTTFTLSHIQRGPLLPVLDADAAVRSLLAAPVEAWSCESTRLVRCETAHAFAQAAHDAFYKHHPLVIRPDDVWFCLLQGLAHHVHRDAEGLRSRVVSHEGQAALIVQHPGIVLGRPSPWPEAFAAFSALIAPRVGALGEFVGASFSTSTPTRMAAFDVSLMDAFQGYFKYILYEGCGIPEFIVLGTEADWQSIRAKLPLLAPYGLGVWAATLDPVLARIAATVAGEVDEAFWQSFFRHQSRSGGSEMTGWIVTLFPYLKRPGSDVMQQNGYLARWRERLGAAQDRGEAEPGPADQQGPDLAHVPSSLASAPVIVRNPVDESQTTVRVVAGMFGVEQEAATGALSAAFGWAVVEEGTA